MTKLIAKEFIEDPYMLYDDIEIFCNNKKEMQEVKKILKNYCYTNFKTCFIFNYNNI
jgi:hypothetical protein